jgi:membrane protein implicated in regulation of membrane protease activity
MFLVALTLALLALPFALTAAALGLNNAFPESWRPWVGFACIFLLMVVGAAVLVWRGLKKVKRIRPPQQTIDSVKGTAAALRRRGDSADEG